MMMKADEVIERIDEAIDAWIELRAMLPKLPANKGVSGPEPHVIIYDEINLTGPVMG